MKRVLGTVPLQNNKNMLFRTFWNYFSEIYLWNDMFVKYNITNQISKQLYLKASFFHNGTKWFESKIKINSQKTTTCLSIQECNRSILKNVSICFKSAFRTDTSFWWSKKFIEKSYQINKRLSFTQFCKQHCLDFGKHNKLQNYKHL